jgi:hypothetical protein
MPAMLRRRIFALAAAFAVSFGALWPLVSVAKPRSPGIPVFLCTQGGGVQQHPGAPSDAADDFHCPLCIATSVAVVPAVPATDVAPLPSTVETLPAVAAAPGELFLARPPPSRAPPALS